MDAERGRALLCSWRWDTRGWPQRPSSQQCLQHTVLKSYRPAPTQADCPTFKQTSPKMSRYSDASVGGLKQEDFNAPGLCSCVVLALSTLVQVPCACAQKLGASPSSRGQTDGRGLASSSGGQAAGSRSTSGSVGCSWASPSSIPATSPPAAGSSPPHSQRCHSSPATGTPLTSLKETQGA